jgi:glycosyltransferase A (GT-A) superfamily protein (DUF2064 family)
VFGEGADGGYYLVGVKQKHSTLFDGIDWSTSLVLTQSLDKAAQAGLSVALTPVWYDIDTIEDFQRLAAELSHLPHNKLKNTRKILADFDL